MRLLSLSPQTRQYIQEGKLTQGHGKIMVGLDPKLEKKALQTIVGQKLSVREAEKLIKKLKEPETKSKKSKKSPPTSLEKIKEKIDKWGYKTKISNQSLTISFKNENEMETFLTKINQ